LWESRTHKHTPATQRCFFLVKGNGSRRDCDTISTNSDFGPADSNPLGVHGDACSIYAYADANGDAGAHATTHRST
jgi:hypothetical protein